MNVKIYNLPDIDFIGGESQLLKFSLFTPLKQTFNADGYTAQLSIIQYSNKNGQPLLVKDGIIAEGTEPGCLNVLEFELDPEDTVDFYGRYVYQLSMREGLNTDGSAIGRSQETEIPGQGIVNITRNIHREFITG